MLRGETALWRYWKLAVIGRWLLLRGETALWRYWKLAVIGRWLLLRGETALWRYWKLAVIGRWLLFRGDHSWSWRLHCMTRYYINFGYSVKQYMLLSDNCIYPESTQNSRQYNLHQKVKKTFCPSFIIL